MAAKRPGSNSGAGKRRGPPRGPPTHELVDLNFKVPGAFHRTFKIEAAKRDMSCKAMLEAMARQFWGDTAPEKPDPPRKRPSRGRARRRAPRK